MSIKVESSTDTDAQVLAAQGGSKEPTPQAQPEQKAEEKVGAKESAEGEEPSETLEASEAQEKEETEELEAKDQDPEKPKKKGGKLQQRISKLVQKATTAEQERDYWREQALKAGNAPAKETPAADKKPPEIHGKPKPEDFATHDEWVFAVADWKAEQKLQEREQKAKELQLKQDAQNVDKALKVKIDDYAKDHPDFDDVIHSVDDIPISEPVKMAIRDSDLGPALMYELAKDPDFYEELCQMPPTKVFREIGKLEAKISDKAQSKKTETKTTKAPEPINPVGGNTSTTTPNPETMSMREYRKWREANFSR